jgi:hypothetical protein
VNADNQRWTFTYEEDVFKVTNMGATDRLLQYNSSSPRFACYTGNQKNLTLYKKASSTTTDPFANVSSSAIDFGRVQKDSAAPKSLTVTPGNLTSDLTLSIQSGASSAFSITTTTIGQAETAMQTITVTFKPTALETYEDTLVISGGGLEKDVKVALSGEGFELNVANIAAFKATSDKTDATVYTITNDLIFVWSDGNRNTYVKDATGGLLIYGSINARYDEGDTIRGGIKGSLTVYNGLFEFIPVGDMPEGIPGAPVEPIELTMEELLNDFTTYESQLIKLDTAQFTEDKTFTGSNSNYNIMHGDAEMLLRANYNGNLADIAVKAGTNYSITGFAVPYITNTANDKQIAPRNGDDIVNLDGGTDAATQDQMFVNISLYPNPVTDKLHIEAESAVQSIMVYNMAGQMMAQQFGQNQINIANLSNGIYAVRITLTDGSVLTTKIVKK